MKEYRKAIRLLHVHAHEQDFKAFVKAFFNYVKAALCRLDLIPKGFYVREFHRVYYYSSVWKDTYWLGARVLQCPLDMWVLQEIIYETAPDFIIETGTCVGGSAYFFAHIFDLIGHGKVITIDVEDRPIPSHPRVIKIIGDSISGNTINKVESVVGGGRSMVFLDSLHNAEHVLKELELYSQFVSKGCYLIIADTNVNGHPVLAGFREGNRRGGPMEAVDEFIKYRDEFVIDRQREKFFMTQFPRGFLLRIR
jgi:cephalosporin hydroxylase